MVFRRAGTAALIAICVSVSAATATAAPKGGAAVVPAAAGQSQADAIADSVIGGLWTLTDAHFHKGEYNHIINLSRMVIAGRPDVMDAYADSAWLLWSMDRDAEAVALYEQGIKANPDTSYMYDELGTYYALRKKDDRKAIQYYEQARRFKDQSPYMLHSLAHAYERIGEREKALAVWEEAAKHPDDGAARANLARLRRQMQGSSPPKP